MVAQTALKQSLRTEAVVIVTLQDEPPCVLVSLDTIALFFKLITSNVECGVTEQWIEQFAEQIANLHYNTMDHPLVLFSHF